MKSMKQLLLALPLLAAANASPAQDMSKIEAGQAVFQKWCSACHGPGRHTPGTMALFFKYGKDMPTLLELRGDLTEETLAYFIRNGVSVMPSFRKTEISDSDIAAIAQYLAHSAASAPAMEPKE